MNAEKIKLIKNGMNEQRVQVLRKNNIDELSLIKVHYMLVHNETLCTDNLC
jgi:hypothetical protein